MNSCKILLILSLTFYLSICVSDRKEKLFNTLRSIFLSTLDVYTDLNAPTENLDFASWLKSHEKTEPKFKKDYFKSYASHASHLTMLQDQPRTDAYYTACIDNHDYFTDKIVLDVGCGTGILSFFAVWAGAKHVYCVDNADIINFVFL